MQNEMMQLICQPLHENRAAIFFVCVLMAMDIITGVSNAAVHNELDSTKMRDGLSRKLGSLYAIVAASVIDSMLGSGLTLSVVDAPILTAACLYLSAMEILSLVENIKKLNPELVNLPGLKQIAERLKEKE